MFRTNCFEAGGNRTSGPGGRTPPRDPATPTTYPALILSGGPGYQGAGPPFAVPFAIDFLQMPPLDKRCDKPHN